MLVISEACTNSVEHAYRGHSVGTMLIEVDVVGGEVQARVGDWGSWKTPAAQPRNGGRGLPLIRAISNSVELHCTAAGTTIEISFQLPAAAEAVNR